MRVRDYVPVIILIGLLFAALEGCSTIRQEIERHERCANSTLAARGQLPAACYGANP